MLTIHLKYQLFGKAFPALLPLVWIKYSYELGSYYLGNIYAAVVIGCYVCYFLMIGD